MIEKFIEIKEYPNYKVSNLGRVKSIDMDVWNGKVFYKQKGRILKHNKDNYGYSIVRLSNGKIKKTIKVHKIMAMTFLNHIPNGYKTVIDHIDNDKDNNELGNLQLISHRENTTKETRGASKYVGVSLRSKDGMWVSQMWINGKKNYLGAYKTQLEAHNTYQSKLKEITNERNL